VTVADAPDPLEVLEKLLGSEGKGAVSKSQGNGVSAAEEDFELELDFEGLGLREFASRGSSTKKEHVYATQTVEECRFCSQPYGMMLILHDSRTRQSEV
jgi:hypothetical protein